MEHQDDDQMNPEGPDRRASTDDISMEMGPSANGTLNPSHGHPKPQLLDLNDPRPAPRSCPICSLSIHGKVHYNKHMGVSYLIA